MKRPTWNQYFMKIAEITSERSTCLSDKKGAVIVKDNRIIATGYSGAPSKVKSCYETGVCEKRKLGYGHGEGHHVCRSVHAEANAIISAAKVGVSIDNSIMYCTHKPCESCMKLIINSGIKYVYYENEYDSQMARKLSTESGVQLVKICGVKEKDKNGKSKTS